MNRTVIFINEILESVRSDVNMGSVFYDDEKFIDTIEGLNAIKLLLAQEYKKRNGIVDEQ